MATNVRDTMKGLSPARRKKIEARTATLIAEEMSLRDLRQALTLTQERIAESLGIGQDWRFAPRKTQRFAAVHAANLRRSHGRCSSH